MQHFHAHRFTLHAIGEKSKGYINQSINNPTFTRRIEEKASERRSGFSLEFLQAAHGRNDLAFEVGLAGCYHATHGVGLEMFPHQLIRIAIRRVSRKVKQLEP